MKNKKQEEYDWSSDNIECTKCKKLVNIGHGVQFIDNNSKCQRYCLDCYKNVNN
jgi:hypothetical protein